MMIFRLVLWMILVSVALPSYASKQINIYIWANIIPQSVLNQFEMETGIKINATTFDSNETLYTKLRTSTRMQYDIVQPSGYMVSRLIKQNLLQPLDHTQLPNKKNIFHLFEDQDYTYHVPVFWGMTGIFVNQQYIDPNKIKRWSDLWQSTFRKQLLLLDEIREVFSIALLSLAFNVNSHNPAHIALAYQQLIKLYPNVKILNSDAPVSIMIDEDAIIGMAMNSDAVKARQYNPNIQFIFPEEGYLIWLDALAIPKGAANVNYAHQFINFMLRPDIAAACVKEKKYAVANQQAIELLPESLRNDPILFPSKQIIAKASRLKDLDTDSLALYSQYWQRFKLGG